MLLRAHYEPGCAILRIARNEVKWNPLARMVFLIGPSASLGMTVRDNWDDGMGNSDDGKRNRDDRKGDRDEIKAGRMDNLLPMLLIGTLGMGKRVAHPTKLIK